MRRSHTYSGHIWLPLILVFVLWTDWSGRLDGLKNLVIEQRMAMRERAATGDIIHVKIDGKSLDQVGVWPWPRSKTAEIVERLLGSGAGSIVLDLDFSSVSNPEDDLALSRVLEAADGGVILPVGTRNFGTAREPPVVGRELPIPILRNHVWLALAEVPVDRDGVVRTLPYEGLFDGRFVPSVAAALAGGLQRHGGAAITIDYSISPETVPTYSAADLLGDRIDPAILRGKTVLLGTDGVRPGDSYFVTAQGSMPGSLIQILGAETLLQDRNLQSLPATPFILAFALLLFGLSRPQWLSELSHQLIVCFALAAVVAVVGMILQTHYAIILPTVPVQLLFWLYAVSRSLNELTIRRWRFLQSSMEASNMRHMLTHIIADSSDAILVVDEEGTILETNRRAPEIFDFDTNVRPGTKLSSVVPGELVAGARASILELKSGAAERSGDQVPRLTELPSGRSVEYTITPSCLSGRGHGRGRADKKWYVACITARDVTEKRHQEARLEYMSRFDDLTGAMRRSEFLKRLEKDIVGRKPDAAGSQVVFALNLHRFKTINATLGRTVGDTLLKAIVSRLDRCELGLSASARLGGDIFALYTLEAVSGAAAQQISRRLAEILETPFDLDGIRAQIGVRIGISPVSGKSPSPAATSLMQAELALDSATRTGGSGAVTFDPHSFAHQEKAREIERELWSALDKREFHIVYQPQVTLSDRKIVGAEALVRWNHPRLGAISPADFIDIAEANGFVEKLGRWILHRACEDALAWPDQITVSVNVSPIQFARGGFVGDVKAALRASGLKPQRLHLEITESAFINSPDDLLDTLHELRELGVSFALDDFGTGFSSFGYLSKFPLDAIKLDQMFVRNITSDRVSQAIVQSIKALADGLDLTLICEGVENEDQLRFLRLVGCHQGQGYLFGKPQTSDNLAQSFRSEAVLAG